MSADTGRSMELTAELAALCHREVADPGDEPGWGYLADADYDAAAQRLAAEAGEHLWIFAYGSLVWKPEFDVVEKRRVRVEGWRRAFCMNIRRWRGSAEQPGLMMALEPGGYCDGVALRVPDEGRAGLIRKMLVREVGTPDELDCVRWIDAESDSGMLRSLTFYAGTGGLDYYAGGLPDEEVARILSLACGHWGSGAEYLQRTVAMLEDHGIHDEGLWRLQELTAEAVRLRFGLPA